MKNKMRFAIALTLVFQNAAALGQASGLNDRLNDGVFSPETTKHVQFTKTSLPRLSPLSEIIDSNNQLPVSRKAPAKITLRGLDAGLRGQDRGGGNAVGDELFDFVEAGTLVEVENLAIAPKLNAVLAQLKQVSPQFSLSLAKAIKNSRWVFDKLPLSSTGCLNESLSGAKKTVVACQNQIEIRVFEPWFLNPKVSDRSKVGLIFHEAVRRIGYTDPFVTQVTRDIFDLSENRVSSSEFLKTINSYAGWGVGRFMSRAESCEVLDSMRDSVNDDYKSGHFTLSRLSLCQDAALLDHMDEITSLSYGTDNTRDQRRAAAQKIVNDLSVEYGCVSQLRD